MKDSMPVILEIGKEYEKLTGRKYRFFEEYMMDDADVALVVMGSSAGTGKEAVDRLRAEGRKVGLIKLRVFRPFPRRPLAAAMCKVRGCSDHWTRPRAFSNSGAPAVSMKPGAPLYDLPDKTLRSKLHLRSGRQRYKGRGLLRHISGPLRHNRTGRPGRCIQICGSKRLQIYRCR